MTIWRIIAHHESPDEALKWSVERGRIAVGWGRIGDLREGRSESAQDIAARISQQYPDATNAHTGGPSLRNFFSGIQIGDLVIVSGGSRRVYVVEVTGPYIWASAADSFGDYQHQRAVVVTEDNPDDLWALVGSKVADGQNVRWTVARCSENFRDESEMLSRQCYSEGSRYDIVSQGVERNPEARIACLAHHGCRCAVCDIDFGERYGDLGRGFIHVHHLSPIADARGERDVDPVSDLIPLCPNCHAMVHRCRPPLTVDQLKERLSC